MATLEIVHNIDNNFGLFLISHRFMENSSNQHENTPI